MPFKQLDASKIWLITNYINKRGPVSNNLKNKNTFNKTIKL